MREFAHQQTGILMRRFGLQVNRAARAADAETIHDLRVAIRRLNRCLRVFAQFYSGPSWKKMRRRLKDLMDACGRVRDRDIALELLSNAGFPPDSIVALRLKLERAEALHRLQTELQHWRGVGAARQWQTQ